MRRHARWHAVLLRRCRDLRRAFDLLIHYAENDKRTNADVAGPQDGAECSGSAAEAIVDLNLTVRRCRPLRIALAEHRHVPVRLAELAARRELLAYPDRQRARSRHVDRL